MNNTTLVEVFIAVMVWYCILIGRFFYFGYIKAPKEIERLKSENRQADATKWEEYRDKCKMWIAVIIAVAVLSAIFFVS